MMTREENLEMNQEIAELIRHIRWRVDQELTRRNIEPLFKDNYTDKYDKHEFLIDADVEFSKIKKLLEKNPSMLRSDPILSLDYFKIIDLIKQKKLLEATSDHFDPENSFLVHHNDEQMVEKDRMQVIQDRLRAFEQRVSVYLRVMLQLLTCVLQNQFDEGDVKTPELDQDLGAEESLAKKKRDAGADRL